MDLSPFYSLSVAFLLDGGKRERERKSEALSRGSHPKNPPSPLLRNNALLLFVLWPFFGLRPLTDFPHRSNAHTKRKRTPRGCHHHFSSIAIAGFQVNGIRQTFKTRKKLKTPGKYLDWPIVYFLPEVQYFPEIPTSLTRAHFGSGGP